MGLVEALHSYIPSATLLEVGPLSLHWYGFLLALAVVIGYAATRRLWRERGYDTQSLDRLLPWLLVCGLVGARLADVFIFEWWYFREHPWQIPVIWGGGLSFHGGLLGGFLLLWQWQRKRQLKLLATLSTFAPGLLLAQAIGRWGNYFNQELFGLPTNLPWGIPIALPYRPEAYLLATYFHPVFLYESLGLLLLALGLWWMRRKVWYPRYGFALYLVSTGVLRFALEFIRLDEQQLILGTRAGVWVALILVTVGLALWFFERNKVSRV